MRYSKNDSHFSPSLAVNVSGKPERFSLQIIDDYYLISSRLSLPPGGRWFQLLLLLAGPAGPAGLITGCGLFCCLVEEQYVFSASSQLNLFDHHRYSQDIALAHTTRRIYYYDVYRNQIITHTPEQYRHTYIYIYPSF